MSTITVEEAVSLLARHDEGEIAELMEVSEIRGNKAQASSCPIARWITKVTGERVHVEIGYVDYHGGDASVCAPPSVTMFIVSFDNGDYPHLEEA